MPPSSRSYQDYTVGWICAVEPELIEAKAMLDDIHRNVSPTVDGDSNSYTFGRIEQHNVVIAPLPSGIYGTNPAATVAKEMLRSFPRLRFGLLVGIGGGVPGPTVGKSADIRLGDVVVSDPTHEHGGVIQYDRGKIVEGEQRLERTGTLNKPPTAIRTAVSNVKARHTLEEGSLEGHLGRMINKHSNLEPTYTYQGEHNDILYEAEYMHDGRGTDCTKCLKSRIVSRSPRISSHPHVHYGTIASGHQVVKDSVTRDYWGSTEGVKCFEMEAAGLMDDFPCLVIRGICDYADSHENQRWQPYAAATAAAYAKDLLLNLAPTAAHADPLVGGQPESGNVHWMVPRQSNQIFTGRTDILEKLSLRLVPQSDASPTSEKQRRFVIVGEGEIGKSEVSLKFADDHRQNFWGIFWIDASSEETAKQAFIVIGERCEAHTKNFEGVKTWFASIRQSWLLIIDNADKVDLDYAQFFPSGNRGNIVLTTRNPHCRDHASVGFENLEYLNLQDAKSLLFKAAAMVETSGEDNQQAAQEIVRILGFYTLALISAGAYIKYQFCTLNDYPNHFARKKERVLKYSQKQEQSTYRSVYATFEASATHLESSQDEIAAGALSLLHILSFIHFQEIPELMFSRAWE